MLQCGAGLIQTNFFFRHAMLSITQPTNQPRHYTVLQVSNYKTRRSARRYEDTVQWLACLGRVRQSNPRFNTVSSAHLTWQTWGPPLPWDLVEAEREAVSKSIRCSLIRCPGGARSSHGVSSEPQPVSSVTTLARCRSELSSAMTWTVDERLHSSFDAETTAFRNNRLMKISKVGTKCANNISMTQVLSILTLFETGPDIGVLEFQWILLLS